jgi:hypothetical protein
MMSDINFDGERERLKQEIQEIRDKTGEAIVAANAQDTHDYLTAGLEAYIQPLIEKVSKKAFDENPFITGEQMLNKIDEYVGPIQRQWLLDRMNKTLEEDGYYDPVNKVLQTTFPEDSNVLHGRFAYIKGPDGQDMFGLQYTFKDGTTMFLDEEALLGFNNIIISKGGMDGYHPDVYTLDEGIIEPSYDAAFVRPLVEDDFDIIVRLVNEVRMELAFEYDVDNPESDKYRYRGLCDLSIERLNAKLPKTFALSSMHGELKHSLNIDPDHWPSQHTVCRIISPNGETYYVDPTIDQFKDVLPWTYSHNYRYGYVSVQPFGYFYSDRKNPQFNGWTKWLNEKIVFERRVPNWDIPVHDGIIEYIQYEIWGGIARGLRKILGIERRHKDALHRRYPEEGNS